MKRYINNPRILLPLVLAFAMFFIGCSAEDDVKPETTFVVDDKGYSSFNQDALQKELNSLPKEDLTAEEKAGLIFMREEEKLARDVYIRLYENWNNQVFDNISNSEQTHMEAVLLLLNKYNLTDPVGSNGIGLFTDTTLQSLYDDLMISGAKNEIEALKVGAAIEEIDILDLKSQLDEVVDNQDIEMVYENLRKGSRNHLRAFVKNLDNKGVTYEPQYLSQEEYDQIIHADMEAGVE